MRDLGLKGLGRLSSVQEKRGSGEESMAKQVDATHRRQHSEQVDDGEGEQDMVVWECNGGYVGDR